MINFISPEDKNNISLSIFILIVPVDNVAVHFLQPSIEFVLFLFENKGIIDFLQSFIFQEEINYVYIDKIEERHGRNGTSGAVLLFFQIIVCK